MSSFFIKLQAKESEINDLKTQLVSVNANVSSFGGKFDELDKKVESELDSLKVHVDDLERSLTENVDTLVEELIKTQAEEK